MLFDLMVYLLLAICIGVLLYVGYRAGYYVGTMDARSLFELAEEMCKRSNEITRIKLKDLEDD